MLGRARPSRTSPEHLPVQTSDLAQQTLKDPYLFDFLTLAEPARERELEQGLVTHVERFEYRLIDGSGRTIRLGDIAPMPHYVTGANIAGFRKVADAMLAFGLI